MSSMEMYRLAFLVSPVPMLLVDETGEIVLANAPLCTLFEYEEEDLIGRSVEELVPQAIRGSHPELRKAYARKPEKRDMGTGRDRHGITRNGRSIPVEIALTPAETPEKVFVMSTIIDLTERMAAKADIEAKNEELVSLNADLSQFAYSASHDLKAPLLSVSGILQICIEDLENGEMEELLENLKDAEEISQRSARKVEAVLQIARAGLDSVPTEPVHMRQMLEDVWLDVAGRTEHVRLEHDLTHAEPLLLERATFGVIIENLLSNAFRYRDEAKPERVVRVSTEDRGTDLHVKVADNGIGIPVENQPHVFEMFKRLDDRSGNGLGLALVRKQIERLGGTVSLSSTEGEGTEFALILPRGGQRKC